MKVVIASTSELKVQAVKNAFNDPSIEFIAVKADSNVSEQPMNEQTLTGAFNRIDDARRLSPGADFYVSIENGIFEEDGKFIDRAIVTIGNETSDPVVTYSDGVEFPKNAVEETRKRGFDQWTVGKVMAEMLIVKSHSDPHLDLSGKSRVAYITETAEKAVSKISLT